MVRMAAETVADEGDIDLRALGLALWRRKAWILWPTLLVAVLATIGVNMMTPRYKSEARILYDGRENVFLRPEADKSLNGDRPAADAETLTSQVQIILSRQLALDVIRQLRLSDLPEFDPVLRGTSTFRHILSLLGIARDYMAMTPEERVLESWNERLTAYSVDKSRVIVIEFQSWDPQLAARVTNAISDSLSAHGAERAPGADPRRRRVAVRGDRTAASESRRRRSQGRGVPGADQPAGRHQQHDAERPAARRAQLPGRRRPRAEG